MSQEPTSFFGWILAAFTTITTALSSGIAFLYHAQIKEYERERLKLESEKAAALTAMETLRTNFDVKLDKLSEEILNCHKEHGETKEKFARIDERLRLLEERGCTSDMCAVRKSSTKDSNNATP